ncbi:hypothetical protein MSHO_30800 [Mycobacterium shottsii]|uniref:Uncharacterized protein n=1 Tax=Mycobacterium shottsii TaxID=133549 RepID=A0A7I7LD68_9MYCO|nr:hypothetical protein MSHO_30800 [Mycobacterium shottsii]
MYAGSPRPIRKLSPMLGIGLHSFNIPNGVKMMLKLSRLGAAILGGVAALMFSTAVATADPPDPHQPDMTKGYCPGAVDGVGANWPCATARNTPTGRSGTSG